MVKIQNENLLRGVFGGNFRLGDNALNIAVQDLLAELEIGAADTITRDGAAAQTALESGVAGDATIGVTDGLVLGAMALVATTDTLVLNLSEDAYLGDAQFTVSVNGVQVGGVQTVTAQRSAGLGENFTLSGNFGSGALTVAISFVNDVFAVSPSGVLLGDRNLYVNAITLNNLTTFENASQLNNGAVTYSVNPPSGAVASNAGSSDTLVLNLSELAASGIDAQFMVSVDGQQVGDVETVTASHAAGASQNVTLTGDFGPGIHSVTVDYLNGWAGNPADLGRTLYVNAITLDGATTIINSVLTVRAPTFYSVAAPSAGAAAVAITAQVLLADTGISATDNITSNGAVTLTGTESGPTGTIVTVFDGTGALAPATLNGTGGWSFATVLAAGTHALYAVATAPSGATATTATEPTITVETAHPSVAITSAVQTNSTVTVTGTMAGAAGTVVELFNGSSALGAATLNGTGSWTYSASLAAMAYNFDAVATDLAGNTTTSPTDPFTVTAPAATDTLVLNLSEDSYLGDAQFTVSVNGVQIGGVQTVTAQRSAGQGENFTLSGNFGSGALTVAISYINDLFGFSPTGVLLGDRNLYVNAIMLNNLTTYENSSQLNNGTVNYVVNPPSGTVASNAGSTDTLVLNLSELAASFIDAQFMVGVDGQLVGDVQTVTASHAAGASQTITLTGDFGPGMHSVTIDFLNGWAGNPADVGRTLYVNAITLDGATTTINSVLTGRAPISYAVAAPSTGAPSVAITVQVLLADTGISATDNITSNGAVTLTGTESGPTGTAVEVFDGTSALGAATLNGTGGWSFATVLAAGTNALYAVATAPSGATATTTTAPTITVETAHPTVAITSVVQTNSLVTISGTVAGASGTVVELFNASSALGAANLNGIGGWTYSANLAAMAYSFDAVATDLAGNATTSAADPFTVTSVTPTVAISSQVLFADTGISATDNITSNGAVTLTGIESGPTGTVVTVFDGTSALGSATLTGAGGWSFSTVLAASTHALYAVATSPSGATAKTATEPTIMVETARPSVAITSAVQTNSTVTVSGTVAGAAGTVVELFNGSTALGAATLNATGGWSFSASFAAMTYQFDAVATDLAGNATTSATDPFTVTAPVTTPPNIVVATISTGTRTTTQSVDISAAVPNSGTYVATSPSGSIGASPLVLFNWNPATQLAGFLAAEAAAKAGTATSPVSLVAIGDSTTRGYGSASLGWTALSYISETERALVQDGVAAQSDSFFGGGVSPSNGLVEDNRIALVGGATTPFIIDAGGVTIGTMAAGQGFNFTLSSSGNYNRVTISYIDLGSGSVSVAINGGPVLATLQFGNSGETLTQTVDIPAGMQSQLNVLAVNANPTYIEGAAFWSTTSPAISVTNAGIDGWTSTSADTSIYNGAALMGSTDGYGATAGVAATDPSLVLIDLGINDINSASATTAQTVANIAQMVASLRSVGSEAIIVIPQPFSDAQYATQLPALRAALEALSLADDVPIIDLSATYGNNYAALAAAGLMSDTLHPDATLYADIGSQIAALLTGTIAASVSAASSSTSLTAAAAGTLVTGVGPASVLQITTGGTAILNPATSVDIVQLNFATHLTLSAMSFITAIGSSGADTITAGATYQTLTGNGGGDTLVGFSGGLDLFSDTSAGMSAATMLNFLANDAIDITNLAFPNATLKATASGANTMVTVSSGTMSSTFTLAGAFASAAFLLASDGKAGTLITAN